MGRMSRLEKWFVNRYNRYMYNHIVKGQLKPRLHIPESGTLLEIGCGTGHAAILINDICKPRILRVTDYDPSQVKRAEETFLETYNRIPSNVILETADALNLQYDDGTFDAVFAFLVLHHLGKFWNLKKQMLRGLDEIGRVLKVGGHLTYLEIWKKRTLKDHLRSNGYDIVYQKKFFSLAELVVALKVHGQNN